LRLPESTLEVRAIQTRKLEASSEIAILTATIAVLQDMEFNIDRIEKPLGAITASKLSDADSKVQKTGLFFLDMLCVVAGGGSCEASSMAMRSVIATLQDLGFTIDQADAELGTITATRLHDYTMRMTVTVVKKKDRQISVRANARIGERAVTDAETYQDFFAVLNKSLFLTLHKVD
jgi:hypothetical protein